MTRKKQFITLVQTAAIVESLSQKLAPSGHHGPGMKAAAIVNVALQVPEEKLPESLSEACGQLIRHLYEDTIPKPTFLLGII